MKIFELEIYKDDDGVIILHQSPDKDIVLSQEQLPLVIEELNKLKK